MFARRWLLMAALALAALAAVRGAPPPMDEDLAELARSVRAACLADSGVDVALVERVNAGAPLMDDARLKCYTRCVMETAGMLDTGGGGGGGEVDVEVVLALLDERTRARNEAALRACGTQRGADLCDTAWRTQRCWQAANPPDYYLI